MSSLDTFLGNVRPWAPGVPDPTAYKNIRLAAIEFCERTRLWRYEDEYDVTEADCIGGVSTPSGSVLHDIEVVLFDGNEILPKATRDLDRLEKGWRTGALGSGLPRYYTQIEESMLRIVPAYAGTLYLCLRLKPSQTSTDLPDFMDNYRECIGWGALGRLLSVPGQPYSNPELASFYMGRFSDKLDRLSIKGSVGQQNAPKRSHARFF
jgi:hypothetical protein